MAYTICAWDALYNLVFIMFYFSFYLAFLISDAKIRHKCAGFMRRKEKVSEKITFLKLFGQIARIFTNPFYALVSLYMSF